MFPSGYDFHEFYLSETAQAVSATLGARLQNWWPQHSMKHNTLVGLGFALPYLAIYPETQRCFAVLPPSFGPMRWPLETANRTVLASRRALPLPDRSVDRVVLVHELEFSEDPHTELSEVWRVLKDDGKIIIITPNRHGVWARFERTPFGQGRPYSLQQLRNLLADSRFVVERSAGALVWPPLVAKHASKNAFKMLELASKLLPALSGVVVVEASKRLYAPIGVKAAEMRVKPNLSPAQIVPTA